MNDYSTLALLDKAYGSGAASSWLVPAIANLNIFTGSKNMNDDQTEKLATLIAQEYKDMKYSVMQLFFYRFKCGHFGKFYGKVDPMVIICALKDFAEECEQKREEYQTEEYLNKVDDEDTFRKDVYRYWYNLCQELFSHVNPEDKDTLTSIDVAEKYTYNYGLFPDLLKEETIKLPVCTDGSPDWTGMEKFVENIDTVALKRMHSLQQPAIPRKIDCEHWKPFSIGNLFKIVKGTRLTKANMLPGDTNFIGASYENNGVTMHISNKGHIHPAGTITVSYNGAHTGVAFYQDEEFWASDDINVLYPKFPINKDIAMFLLPIIKKTGAKYGFIDKWEKEVMAQDELILPSKDGKPDWEYMEKYIKYIRNKTAKIVAYAESLNITKEENE